MNKLTGELNADNALVQQLAQYLSTSYVDDPETPHFMSWAMDIIRMVVSALGAVPDEELVENLAAELRGYTIETGGNWCKSRFTPEVESSHILSLILPILRAKAERHEASGIKKWLDK